MSLLAMLLLATATTRVEAVTLTTDDSHLAIRVALSGPPGRVGVHRESEGARVSIADVALGGAFAGGARFAWSPAVGFDPARLSAPARLDRIDVAATPGEVSVLLGVPPEVSIDVRSDPAGLLLVLREVPEASVVAQAEPPSPTPIAPETTGEDESPPAATADTADLARGLFPADSAASKDVDGTGGASVEELYAQLFPGGAPQTDAETIEPGVEAMGGGAGVPVGPFRVRGGIDARYVDADTFIAGPQSAARDRYLEVLPRIVAEAPLSDGRFEIGYSPAFRAFATYDETNSTSHRVGAGVDFPVGPSVELYLKDNFVSGTLETREVDPGGEYFFGLGKFRRNTIDGGASLHVGPRLSLELRGTTSQVRFLEESSFFDHDNRRAAAGLGYELTPNLRTTLWYQYDEVPTPIERPEAASSAHNGQLTFTGDLLPLLTGELMLGYRDQRSPNAAAGGTRFTGFTMGGSLTKRFTRESSATLFLNRSTPASNFEGNAFYVYTSVQGSARLSVPLDFQLQGGLGYQWNDYRTVAVEIGVPRADRILAWSAGIRRAVYRHLFLSATFRREERTSNLGRFNTNTDGFILQLEWDAFGNTR